jgi:polysaccharide biosynthesis/export protein
MKMLYRWIQALVLCCVIANPELLGSNSFSSDLAQAQKEQGADKYGLLIVERFPGHGNMPVMEMRTESGQTATLTIDQSNSSHISAFPQRFSGKNVVFPDALAPVSSQDEYIIGVEDLLRISVWNNPDLTAESIVRPDGKISLPALGEIHASGLGVDQLQKILAKLYEDYVQNPRVTVLPIQMNSLKVFFVGRAKTQNAIILSRNLTLLEALSSVEFMDDADLSEAYVLRGDFIIPVDITKLLSGDTGQNVLLSPHDKIIIPALDNGVFVLGEVAKPGKLRLARKALLLDAISQAGGPTEKAYAAGAYLVRDGEYVPLELEQVLKGGELSKNLSLKKDDLIYIPSVDDNKVYVLGEVVNPGPVRSSKPLTLLDAIGTAGGFSISASKSSVRIVRGNPKDPLVLKVDMAKMLRGKVKDPIHLMRGDLVYVPSSLLASWNRFVSQVLPGITSILVLEAAGALGK